VSLSLPARSFKRKEELQRGKGASENKKKRQEKGLSKRKGFKTQLKTSEKRSRWKLGY
jgi:hypothetical protein